MNLRKNIGFGRKKKDQGKNKRNSASYRVASAAGRRRPGSQESVPLNVVKGPVEDIRAPETKHTPKRGSVDSLGRIENGKEEEVPSSPRNLRQIHVRPAGTNPSLASDAGPIDEEAAERMAEQRAMEKEEEALKRREKRVRLSACNRMSPLPLLIGIFLFLSTLCHSWKRKCKRMFGHLLRSEPAC